MHLSASHFLCDQMRECQMRNENLRFLPIVVLTALMASSADTASAQWGTLKGRVVVTGDVPDVPVLYAKRDTAVKEPICRAQDIADDSLIVDADSKGVANVFVFLLRAPDQIHPELTASEPDELVFDQKNCRFEPHAMVVQTGQQIVIKSDDPILHNTHSSPFFNSPQNIAIRPNDRDGVPISFRQREPVPVGVKCDLHPWMTAWWLVVDHPYAAVTDEKGEFTIKHLPVGEHTFRVWQERAGWIDKKLKVEVSDDAMTEVVIEVPGDSLKPSR